MSTAAVAEDRSGVMGQVAAMGFPLLLLVFGWVLLAGVPLPAVIRTPVALLLGASLYVVAGTGLIIAGAPTSVAAVIVVTLAVVAAVTSRRHPALLAFRWRDLALASVAFGASAWLAGRFLDEVVSEDSFENIALAGLLLDGRFDQARTFTQVVRPPAMALLHGPSVATGAPFSPTIHPVLGLAVTWLLLGIVWHELGRRVDRSTRTTAVVGIGLLLAFNPMWWQQGTYLNTHLLLGGLVLAVAWSASTSIAREPTVPWWIVGIMLAAMVVTRRDGVIYAALLVAVIVLEDERWPFVRRVLAGLGAAVLAWWLPLTLRMIDRPLELAAGQSTRSTGALAAVGLVMLVVALPRAAPPFLRHSWLRPAMLVTPFVLLAVHAGIRADRLAFYSSVTGSTLLQDRAGWTRAVPLLLVAALVAAAGARERALRPYGDPLLLWVPIFLILRVESALEGGYGLESFPWHDSNVRAIVHVLPIAIVLLLLAVLRGRGGSDPSADGTRGSADDLETVLTERRRGRASGGAAVAVVTAVAAIAGLGASPWVLPVAADPFRNLEALPSDLAVIVARHPLVPSALERAVVRRFPTSHLVDLGTLSIDEQVDLVVHARCVRAEGWGVPVLVGTAEFDGFPFDWEVSARGEFASTQLPPGLHRLPHDRAGAPGVVHWFGTVALDRDRPCNPVTAGLLVARTSSSLPPSSAAGPTSLGTLRERVDRWDAQETLHTDDESQPFYELRLPEDAELELTGLSVRQRRDDAVNLLRGFLVEGRAADGVWMTLGRFIHRGGPGDRDHFVVAPTGQRIVALRITPDGLNSSGGRALVLGDLELYGDLHVEDRGASASAGTDR